MKHVLGLLVVLAAGCGDDGGGDSVASFIGTWTYAAGSTATLDCDNNQLDDTSTSTGSFQVTAGTMSDLIVVPDADDDCPAVRYDVNGNMAMAQSGQGCTFTEMPQPGASVTFVATVANATFTLGADEISLTGSQTGSLEITGAITATCTISQTVVATKAGN